MNNNGFTKVPNAIIRSSILTVVEKMVWCYIASMPVGYRYSVCSACETLHINAKTWRKCVGELEKKRLVSVTIKPGHKNVYEAVKDASGWNLPLANRVEYSNGSPSSRDPSPLPNEVSGTHYYNKEILNNNIDDDVRKRFEQEVMIDTNVELACKIHGITPDQYKQFSELIIAEWKFNDLPDHEWTKKHFMSVLRYKVNDYNSKCHEKRNQKNELGGVSQTQDRYAARRGTDVGNYTSKDYGGPF